MNGSRMLEAYPCVPLNPGNQGLNVGVISCPDLLPDLWRLVDDFDVALEELLECTGTARI